jgi:hypothetical protein
MLYDRNKAEKVKKGWILVVVGIELEPKKPDTRSMEVGYAQLRTTNCKTDGRKAGRRSFAVH